MRQRKHVGSPLPKDRDSPGDRNRRLSHHGQRALDVAVRARVDKPGSYRDNVESLELQWGEVDWRSTLIDTPERLLDGTLTVSD